MAFEIRISQASAGGRSGDVYELISGDGSFRAEVWPQWGFNCLRWQVRQPDGRWSDLLFCASDWEQNPVPTRSGHPILFPFPNRLRDGRMTFEGKTYQLPATERNSTNAIHGFTPRLPWRVSEWNAHQDFAFVTGLFRLGKDYPEGLPFWPADFELSVTYQLHRDRLQVLARVENLGPAPLPFGLGYHPYFRLPGIHKENLDDSWLQAHVDKVWAMESGLPTGELRDVSGALDFRQSTRISSTQLDNVFTSVSTRASEGNKLRELAVLMHPNAPGRLRVLAEPVFQDLVLFTPPHRQAVAIEPYTCSSDAANLSARGIDCGWQTLPVGSQWHAAVEYRWEAIDVSIPRSKVENRPNLLSERCEELVQRGIGTRTRRGTRSNRGGLSGDIVDLSLLRRAMMV